MINFSKTLMEERKAKDLTQKAIAIMLGVPENTYGGWERGYNEPSAEMLIKLADIFECSVDYLLGRANEIGLVAINNDGLTDVEKNLLAMFRRLDREGQVKLYAIVQAYVS